VLKNRKYTLLFLTLIPVVSFLLFLIPVNIIPGNSIDFQAQLFTTNDYVMLLTLSTLESLLIVMFLYFFLSQRKHRLATVGQSNLGLISGVPAFLFGTKLCPMCIAAIFGAFGTGVVASLLQYRNWVFIVSFLVLTYSLYSVSKKINGICERCK